MNLTMLLEMAASADPDRIAIGSREKGQTYGELLHRAQAIGAELSATGARRVALLDLNSVAVPSLIFGAAAAGIPMALLNYRLTDEQIAAAVARLDPVTVIAGETT